MKTKKKNKLLHKVILLLVIAAVIALMFAVSKRINANMEREMEIDPHLGMVEVFNGNSYVWIIPESGVPQNMLTEQDFSINASGEPSYNGTGYASFRGVDVSEHQGEIDWNKVSKSGIDFAIIRVGGRGYGDEGKLVEDARFKENLENAKAAGLKVGVYFFSQAISEEEAREEARFTLDMLDGMALDLPVYFDWEHVVIGAPARTDNLPGAAATDCAIAFCNTVAEAGYKTGIYTNLDTSYYTYELKRLTDFDFWSAAPGSYPYSYYAFSVWQYSFEGSIPGIEAPCDMDMRFVKYE